MNWTSLCAVLLGLAAATLPGCSSASDDAGEDDQALSSSTVRILAAGTPAQGVYPKMELRIGGKTVAHWDAVKGNPTARAFETFTYEHDAPVDPSDIEVAFTNDFSDGHEDRNLFVDKIVVDGKELEAESPQARILAAPNCESGYLEREGLWCDGSIRFVDPELEAIMSHPRCPARPDLGLPEDVYCTDQEVAASRDASTIYRQLTSFIDTARRAKLKDPARPVRITTAFMSFFDESIGDLMCKASAAGVQIVAVIDKTAGVSVPTTLQKPECKPENVHVTVLGGQTSNVDDWRIFHIKMVVVDDGGPDLRFVFGSPNLYAGGYSTWFETWVFAHQPKTAHFAASHLCAVKALDAAIAAAPSGHDADAFSSTYASCVAAIPGPIDAKHRVFFAPDPQAKGRAELLSRIKNAASSVDAAAYFLSDGRLATALGDAAQAGRATRLLMDDSLLYDTHDGSAKATHETWEQKLRPRIPNARFLATNAFVWQLMHHKFVVIDKKAVFFGGGHFTNTAFTSNYDGFYLFDDPKLTRVFSDEFERLYALATPPKTPAPSGMVRIRNKGDGHCLEMNHGMTADGVGLVSRTCAEPAVPYQTFEVRPQSNGAVQLVAKHTGKCLDVWTAATGVGASVGQYTCGTQPNQMFYLVPQPDGAYRIVPAHSLHSLAPAGLGDGQNVVQASYVPGPTWEWTIEPSP